MNSDSKKRIHPVVLIVDDEKSICDTLSGIFQDEGWHSYNAQNGREGLRLYREKRFDLDLVLLDVWMEGLDGIETLQKMKDIATNIPIVIMSGHATIETAVKATKLGALDFLEKPLSLDKILPMIEHLGALKQKKSEGKVDVKVIKPVPLIGQSLVMTALMRQIKIISPRNSWVLITGENGTGKEVVARNIHAYSARFDKPLVAVNCAAIPEELIESELFGHARGAFTNAIAAKRGKFELADGGTLFLDEIGDMSLKTQAKVLRILQEQSFERIGDNQTISVDVRVVAATNKDLVESIKLGLFREDLYYRLNVIPIHMPPLRERRDDIPLFIDFFLEQMSQELSEEKKIILEDAMSCLKQYPWPGNVRELKNTIERVCILAASKHISLHDIPEAMRHYEKPYGASQVKSGSSLKEARNDFEKSFILAQLEDNDWNVSKTAEAIGLERSNLHKKLRLYQIDPKRLKG